MGIRCMLGHEFGEPTVERDREKDGDEMVLTKREVKTCERCGERRVVSENKEVTTIKTPEEVGVDGDPDGADAPGADDGGAHPAVDPDDAEPGPAADPETDDGVILEAGPDREAGEWPDAGEPSAGTPEPSAAVGDAGTGADAAEPDEGGADAEIIDAGPAGDDTSPAADPGPSPEDAPETLAEAAPDASGDGDPGASGGGSPDGADPGGDAWPEPPGEDEGFDAEPGEGGEVSFSGGGLAPEVEVRSPDGEAEYVETAVEESGGGGPPADVESDIAREGSASVGFSGSSAVSGEFYCPNCELTQQAAGSSLRAGDICPECGGGYISERGE